MFVRRCKIAVVCEPQCHRKNEREQNRGYELPCTSVCVYEPDTCLVNYWSYWGCFNAASLTFWRHFTKGLSDYSVSGRLKQFYPRPLLVAVSAVLAKASGFLRPTSDDQNRGVKTKRNWTNQYRPQWGMKQLDERSWGWGVYTYMHTHKKRSTCCFCLSLDFKNITYQTLSSNIHI